MKGDGIILEEFDTEISKEIGKKIYRESSKYLPFREPSIVMEYTEEERQCIQGALKVLPSILNDLMMGREIGLDLSNDLSMDLVFLWSNLQAVICGSKRWDYGKTNEEIMEEK